MLRMIQSLRGTVARHVLIGTITALSCLGFAHNARAEYWVSTMLQFASNEDSLDCQYSIVDLDNPNHYYVLYFWKDGTSKAIEVKDGDPGPDDPGQKKGDLNSKIDLAKQHGGGNWISDREFWDSPAGRSLTAGGAGPKPVINPGDDNDGGGVGNPSRGKEKLGEPIFIDKTGGLGAGEENGFQFNGGSVADQLHQPGGPPGGQGGGGNSNNDDDKGSHKPPPGSNFGPVDLVDPLGPPTGKITLGSLGTNTWTGKRKSGDVFLPHVEQKTLKKSSGKNKGSEHGVIAIIKPGETTGIGNPEIKNIGALGSPDTKGVTLNTLSSPGGHSALSVRMSTGSMSSIGRVGAGVGSLRVR